MRVTIRNYLKGPYTLGDETVDAPVPHKWLPDDEVEASPPHAVTKRRAHIVVGIVDLLNRTRQGLTPRGVPMYMFHPMDAAYPPMIVSSKLQSAANMVAVASIEHWTEKDKWPRAGIQRVLGPVGEKAAEQTALLVRACPWIAPPTPPLPPTLYTEHEEYPGHVVHIDPEGCEDVDDVIMWRQVGDSLEFGIGIADVAAWIPEGCETDAYAEQLGQSLYIDGVPIRPMLPIVCSSLRGDGVTRPVLARMYTIRDGAVEKDIWKLVRVRVTKHTYDSVYKDKDTVAHLTQALRAITGEDVGNDSHHWIELAMIAYNRAAACVLRDAGVGLLRAHAGRTSDEWAQLAQRTGCSELAFLGYAAGEYTTEARGHNGLGLDCYCHATSPLRRYADLVNQRWLKHLLFGHTRPTHSVNATSLNTRGRVAREMDRDLWFLKGLNMSTLTEVEGILVKKTNAEGKGKGKDTIYVPAWKRKIRGKSEGEHMEEVGDRVVVRVYTNLKATNWGDRIVSTYKGKTKEEKEKKEKKDEDVV